MSKIPSKHGRDQALDFQGFLNDLQDWELDKDKKLKSHDSRNGNSFCATKCNLCHEPEVSDGNSLSTRKKLGLVSEERQPVARTSNQYSRNSVNQNRSVMNYDPMSSIPSSFKIEESTVDAVSEKDLGNEYFKQKKFNEAIDCYSRSIALSPTAVAYANRAMAYLKIKRFQEAENDCTEALNLDDRYVKAYSRRATARKELRKLRDSLEDVEFAMRLEPQNEELKKQRAEVKSLLEKAILAKAAGGARRSAPGVEEVESNIEANSRGKGVASVGDKSKAAGVEILPDKRQESMTKPFDFRDKENKNKSSEMKTRQRVNGSHEAVPAVSHLKNYKTGKSELGISVQELASRAASRAMSEAAKNIKAPSSAYQFDASWRQFCGDRSLQARLLKATPPEALPQIFKNAMTAPLLVDIIKCIATLFMEETELAVKYLENMTKIPRFNMIIMCLSSADKADICGTWNEVFLSQAAPIEYVELLNQLYPMYCPR